MLRMKRQMNLFLDFETCEALKAKAEKAGAPMGPLADLLLNYGLERLSDDALRTWAAKRPNLRGPLGGGPTKKETAVLGAFERLMTEGKERFDTMDLAKESGLFIRDAWFALKALQNRSLVNCNEINDKVDRWGRSTSAMWSLRKA